jgi:hypothetical protein
MSYQAEQEMASPFFMGREEVGNGVAIFFTAKERRTRRFAKMFFTAEKMSTQRFLRKFYFLLFTFYFLLFTFYFLLFTFYFLLF